MKKKLWCSIALIAVLAFPTFAEQVKNEASSPLPEVGISVKHDLSLPLRDLVKLSKPGVAGPPREIPMQRLEKPPAAPGLAKDPLLGPIPEGGAPMPAPIITFDGPDDDDNAVLIGFRVAPPDSNGDVGPNHYVQFVNLIFEMFNKTTGATVLGPAKGSDLWIGFGGVCENNNDGDPIALYDQFANRWLMSQFEINSGTQCVAISKTGDPTGEYWRYAFDVSPGLNDYPKIGVWPDGYYMMFHEFNPGFTQTVVVSMERSKMLDGLAAQFVKFNVPPAGGQTFFSVQPPHVEGMNPPAPGAPAPFVMAFDDEDWGAPGVPGTDFYKIWQFHVDWAVPANSTFIGPVNLPSPDWDDNMCNFLRNCIPQPAPGEGLDSFSDVTMYRLVYRNFGTHQSLYVVTGADVGGEHEGVRWAEIRDPLGVPVLFQAGTHAPDAHHRWMPSIAADKDGNIAIGYSVSSSTLMPGIRYAGRLASDPIGTLPQTETSMHEGTGVQTASANRWGDYTSLSIDESDDCTFWYTNQYYQTTGSFDWDMRIGSFKFPSCTQGPTGTLTGTVIDAATTNPIENANIQVGATFATQTNASGVYSITIPIGTYDVTASKFGYLPQTATGVVIADGQTTTQDFALTATPAIVVDGFVTDGSGGNYPLYATVQVVSAGGTLNLWTDPQTGYYSFNALVSTPYTVTATAQLAGYLPMTRTFTTGSADQQENFPLQVNQATCNAPGYSIANLGTVASADFTAGIPAGWTTTNATINCSASGNPQWNTANPGLRANLTGGSGLFAIADSDRCGSTVQFDSNMLTPAFDLTGFSGALRIQFNSDYRDLCTPAQGDNVAVEIFNGTAWSPVFTFCGPGGGLTNRRGPRLESFISTAANGAANAQIRFRYKGRWDWWWEVDNVNVFKSACLFNGGGLFYGNVYDLNTAAPLVGASVGLDTGQTTSTIATPNDPAVDDGFYVIYAPLTGNAPGVRTMTVSKANYGTETRNVVPSPSGAQEQNFNLPAGRLAFAPQAVRERTAIGGSGDGTLTLTNSGTRDVNWAFLELNVPPPPAPAGPIQHAPSPWDENTKEGYYASIATTSANVPGRPAATPRPYPNVGEFVNEYTTTHALPWGAGFNFLSSNFWVSNPGVGGGDNNDHEYTLNGIATGRKINVASAGGTWAADMAFNGLTGMMWQVNVGGDNCIFEFDPASLTLTGDKICPSFGTSERGLAFDPSTGNFFAGTWNNDAIVEFKQDGSIVRQVVVGLNVSGLAYNALTKHLFVQVNDATANQKVHVLDANTPGFTNLGSFVLKNSSGGNAYGDFSGAGLEMDCAGNLWSVNQVTKKIHVNNAGETGACALDIPWLTEDPTSGTIPVGGSTDSLWTFTSSGLTPGCREAQVLVTNDTPYGTPSVTAGLTVQFNDVPVGTFGDAFIHAMAGSGISFGCGAGNFCPADAITRRTMSVWLLRGKLGRFYQPPPAVGIFADVSPESFAADFIEDLYNRGITAGCGTNPLIYCPENPVTRQQMAVFLLVTKEGSGYVPPDCEGLFEDMPCSNGFAKWAEELYRRGITAGCGTNPLRYCPTLSVTRGQMSVFTSVNFGIPKCNQ